MAQGARQIGLGAGPEEVESTNSYGAFHHRVSSTGTDNWDTQFGEESGLMTRSSGRLVNTVVADIA